MLKGQYRGETVEGANLCQLIFIPYPTSNQELPL